VIPPTRTRNHRSRARGSAGLRHPEDEPGRSAAARLALHAAEEAPLLPVPRPGCGDFDLFAGLPPLEARPFAPRPSGRRAGPLLLLAEEHLRLHADARRRVPWLRSSESVCTSDVPSGKAQPRPRLKADFRPAWNCKEPRGPRRPSPGRSRSRDEPPLGLESLGRGEKAGPAEEGGGGRSRLRSSRTGEPVDAATVIGDERLPAPVNPERPDLKGHACQLAVPERPPAVVPHARVRPVRAVVALDGVEQ
jgi:hypothetical protein